MSSFFDEASLVMIPSGYKDQKVYSVKPLDGSGDLTFSRASNATRVASNGLIEKVRENLILQSNTFSDAAWTKFSLLTVTGGQAGYDGTNNAWLLTKPAAGFTGLGQTHTNLGVITGSFYLKAGTLTKATVRLIGTPDVNVIFDLSAGTVFGGTAVGWIARTITSVGNGWYRCSLSLNATASSTFIVYPDEITNTTAGTIFAQAAQLETGDIATDYIATTTTAVSVGPVSGLPRLDYLNSSCPRLLLEPQRTNLLIFSEQFNTSWLAVQASITANQNVSPSGYQDADLIVENTANAAHHVNNSAGISSTAGVHTASAFFKKNTKNFGFIQIATDGATNRYTAVFDLVNGTVTSTTTVGSPTSTSNSIVDYGNGWYRVSVSTQHTSGTLFVVIGLSNSATPTYSATGYPTYTGNGTDSIAMWGTQLELGSYATSYIPTLSTSVTRVIDRFTKLSISSLINSQEGTLFVEMSALDSLMGTSILSLSDGSPDNNLYIGYTATSNQISSVFASGGVAQAVFNTTAFNVTQSNKIAVSYKANDMKMYINGTLVGSDTNANVPAAGTLNEFSSDFGQNSFPLAANISQALIFPTALTATQLAELTTL
jgi:hypothetical protein